jgi:hypothetical protein
MQATYITKHNGTTCNGIENYNIQRQNRNSKPKPKKNDFEVLFENYFKIKIASAKKLKNCRQIIAAALM